MSGSSEFERATNYTFVLRVKHQKDINDIATKLDFLAKNEKLPILLKELFAERLKECLEFYDRCNGVAEYGENCIRTNTEIEFVCDFAQKLIDEWNAFQACTMPVMIEAAKSID